MEVLFECTRCGKYDSYCACKTIVLAWSNKILKEYLCKDCDKKYEKVIKRFFKRRKGDFPGPGGKI